MKTNTLCKLVLLLITLSILLCSCESATPTVSYVPSPQAEQSEQPVNTEVIPSPTDTPTPTPTPTSTPLPAKPTAYTDGKYFTVDELNGVILDYNTEGGVYVNIPETINGVKIRGIGWQAFSFKPLYGVILPDTVTYISDQAFSNTGLVEVHLGNNVEHIGFRAFSDNVKINIKYKDGGRDWNFLSNGIEQIKLPDKLKYIGDKAFDKNSITDLKLPEGLEYIGKNAFANNNLSSADIPDSVTYIGKDAFLGLDLNKIKTGKGHPSHLSIDDDTITGAIGKPMSTLVIPSIPGVNKINPLSFNDYEGITEVDIKPGIEYIGRYAFRTINRLDPQRFVTLPDGIKYINQTAFWPVEKHIFNNAVTTQPGIPDFSDKSPANPLYSFPQSRTEIIRTNISQEEISTFDEISPLEEWAQRYICTKYKDKDITSCNAYCNSSWRDEYYLADVLMCDDYNLIAKMCTITLRTNIDIEGLTKKDLDYYISVQIVYTEDKETGQVTLCGFLDKNEALETKKDLYDYIKADGRFKLNENKLSKKLSQIQSAIHMEDLSKCPVITELTRDVEYFQGSLMAHEHYLPAGKDCVIFFVKDPVNKLFKVNYKTNEIIWEKGYGLIDSGILKYTDRFPDEVNGVFKFMYYNGEYFTDFIDTDGKVIVEDAKDYRVDYISGTDWKVISDNGKITLEDRKTGKYYMILDHVGFSGMNFTSSRFVKAISKNKIVIESTFPGEGAYHNWYFSYDIDTGRLTHMTVYDDLLISNKDDKYVSKIIGTYEYYNKEILYIQNPDDNTSIDIRNWTDPFVCINAYALSKDGKYLALLTADSLIKDEYVITYGNTGIIIIDLEQKKVLVQDELILSYGSLSFLDDNTLVVNDQKTMIYIDVPSVK
ncbi:MAG TPA: leucine-rich repeat domain-containing protein [Clostridia bacterium]|nr:leucine-rich repeat domain-containing protein [Clostridia bacterium]